MKTIDVCGIPFEVKEIEPNNRADDFMGREDSVSCIITINVRMTREMKQSTLIHEWIHSILDTMGFGEISGNENLVSVLQNELYRAGFRLHKRNKK
jgi:Zn-dependent peptidase ImmA (M78 family)